MKIFCIPFLLLASLLTALPRGPSFKPGEAEVRRVPRHVRVETSVERAVIEWESFSIDTNERADFFLPSASSAVLNRVIGDAASVIKGDIYSNGQVILVNQNGIFFSETASIDVGSLLASTLDLNDAIFKSNTEWKFRGTSLKSVCNKGALSARFGDLFLIGHFTDNYGRMEGVEAGLFACKELCIKRTGANRVSVKYCNTPDLSSFHSSLTLPDRAAHLGQIIAKAGTVYLFGDQVVLTESASINVSSPLGGGTVLIGGSFDGETPSLAESINVYIGPQTVIDASATRSGNGGIVVIRSDGKTQFYGTVNISGGPMRGSEGVVQIFGADICIEKGKILPCDPPPFPRLSPFP